MLNVRIALSDQIELSLRQGKEHDLQVSYAPEVKAAFDQLTRASCEDFKRNLASRAADLYLRKVAPDCTVKLKLEKRIPAGGGLGGGSSDAAAVLKMLSEMIQVKISKEELISIALQLGADVPYFLQDAAAWVGGIGEVVNSIGENRLRGSECFLLFPPFQLATPAVYSKFRESNLNLTPDPVFNSVLIDRADCLAKFSNDLELAAGALQPDILSVLAELRTFPDLAVGMTGSGSTIFVLNRSEPQFSLGQIAQINEIAAKHDSRVLQSSIM